MMDIYLVVTLCLPFIWGITLYLSDLNRRSLFNLAFIGAITSSILQMRYIFLHLLSHDVGATISFRPIPNITFAFGVSVSAILFSLVGAIVLILPVYIIEKEKRRDLKLRLFQAFTFYGSTVCALYADNLVSFYSFWEFAALIIMVQPAVRRSIKMRYLFITWISTGLLFFIAVIFLSSLFMKSGGAIDLSTEALKSLALFSDEPTLASKTIYWFLVVSMLARVPLFPAYLWVKNIFTEVNYGILLLVVTCLPILAFCGLDKFVIQIAPNLVSKYAFGTTVLLAFGVVYSAFSMIKASSFRAVVSSFAALQCSLIGIGFFSGKSIAILGGKLQLISYVIVVSGLLLLSKLLENVYGTTFIATISHSSKRVLQLTSTILFIVLASISSPLSLGFHGNVLILTTIFTDNWQIASLVLFGTGVMVVSYLSKVAKVVSVGAAPGVQSVVLPKSMRAIFWGVGTIIITFGIFPKLLLNLLM